MVVPGVLDTAKLYEYGSMDINTITMKKKSKFERGNIQKYNYAIDQLKF